ncbi:MAG: sugar phosphate isomerase/epimerase [Planctomycetes bacterium]|nr:sugar phosphate isomerase/epimerase [Planctomycetota bacterium]
MRRNTLILGVVLVMAVLFLSSCASESKCGSMKTKCDMKAKEKCCAKEKAHCDKKAKAKCGKEWKSCQWRLGIQCWTFNRYSLFEAIDKASGLGLKYIEAYGGQKLSPENPDVKFGHEMPVKYRAQVKKKLKAAGLTLTNYGIVGLSNDEKQCREVFDFAKDMGIETIGSEPSEESLDMIDRLAQEYEINVAIHNHPKPSHYWDADTVLNACKGRSKYIGACADTGHWVRSGLDPIEMIKKLEGRIISFHFKEMDDDHDVIWGTGKNRVGPILKELRRQNFAGVFSIEYEYKWENNLPEIEKCIEYFNKVKAEL